LSKEIRYGDYFREASVESNVISYNDLVPSLQQDSEGNPLPYRASKIQLRAFDAYRIIMPYIKVLSLFYLIFLKKISQKNNK
jgi:hypothetical protein